MLVKKSVVCYLLRTQMSVTKGKRAMGRYNLNQLLNCLAAMAAAMTIFFISTESMSQSSGRIPTSFRWYYQFEPAGWRNWSRQDETTWIERYDNGQKSKFFDGGPADVNGCHGLLLLKDNATLQAFVPNDQCNDQSALFQFNGPNGPTGPWNRLGEMKNIRY